MKNEVTKKVVREVVEVVSRSITCDLCKTTSKGDDWSVDRFDDEEVEIRVTVNHRDGTTYPDGGSGTVCEIDLCPKCFKERLVPWLESQGAKVVRKEWDW